MMEETNLPDNFDFLQNIEFAVVGVYRENPDLTDHNVDKVYEGLMRVYQKELQGRDAPKLRLSELEQTLYDAVRDIIEMRLGHGDSEETDIVPLSIEDAVAALKRLRSSD